MARLARFERAAFRLGGERSILLSYRRTIYNIIHHPRIIVKISLLKNRS